MKQPNKFHGMEEVRGSIPLGSTVFHEFVTET